MKTYHATVRGDKYPTTYTVNASSWATAAARAVKLWRQRFKGTKVSQVHITLTEIGRAE